jgi:hypothetical protein
MAGENGRTQEKSEDQTKRKITMIVKGRLVELPPDPTRELHCILTRPSVR